MYISYMLYYFLANSFFFVLINKCRDRLWNREFPHSLLYQSISLIIDSHTSKSFSTHTHILCVFWPSVNIINHTPLSYRPNPYPLDINIQHSGLNKLHLIPTKNPWVKKLQLLKEFSWANPLLFASWHISHPICHSKLHPTAPSQTPKPIHPNTMLIPSSPNTILIPPSPLFLCSLYFIALLFFICSLKRIASWFFKFYFGQC